MLQTLLLVNLSIFIPLIVTVEYFRIASTYKTFKESFCRKYLPYVFLFIIVNDVAIFHIVPKETIIALSGKDNLSFFKGGAMLGIFSIFALILTLCDTNWRRSRPNPADFCKCYQCRTYLEDLNDSSYSSC